MLSIDAVNNLLEGTQVVAFRVATNKQERYS